MMTKSASLAFLLTLNLCAASRTWTGWFSDEKCARARASSGTYSATNADCARRCIEGGAAVVFIAEQEKALYMVKNYTAAKDDLGYQIEVTGTLDEQTQTLTVQSVKRLQAVGPSCARPKLTR
jgi:hypothetical protein